jgi:hypothetical protein
LSTTADENAESFERNSEQVNRNTAAFSRINRALDTLGTVVGGIIRGAPQSFGELSQAAFGQNSALSTAMQFAEGYIDVWRGLTRSGIHFNNDLEEMIINVGRANIKMEDFTRIVNESSTVFASLGGVANMGVQAFLTSQQKFFERGADGTFNPLRVELERMGMTTAQITETFLAYEQMNAINMNRERITNAERNLRAFEFAKNLDRLSRLTGKQADQLAEQQAEIAREGNVFAFKTTIQEQVRDELDEGLLALGEVSPEIKAYAIDMITRGFPNPDDPEMVALHNLAPQLRETLYEARQAFLAGDQDRAELLMRQAEAEAKNQVNNGRLMRLALLGSATDITSASMNIVTGLANGSAQAMLALERKAAEMFPDVNPGEYTAEQLERATQALLDEDERARLASDTRGQQMLDGYLGGLRELQAASMAMQTELVSGIFGTLYSASETFGAYIRGLAEEGGIELNIPESAREAYEAFTSAARANTEAANLMRSANSSTQQLDDIIQFLAANGAAMDDVRAVQQVKSDLDDAIQTLITEGSSADNMGRIRELAQAAALAIENSNMYRGPDQEYDPSEMENIINEIRDINGRSFGSLGSVGRLFEDFGSRTTMNLHGIESVTTPEQMASIVENSALGALRAMSGAMQENSSNSGTSVLNGMLNTIRNIPAEISAQPQQATGMSELETAMSRLASQMRVPLEEAMNNTLVPRIEQLVQVNTRNADTSDRIRKGIGNIGSDMLRSV